jgi:fluoride exporter
MGNQVNKCYKILTNNDFFDPNFAWNKALMPNLWWQQLGLVALGGALGAMGRFWLGAYLLRRVGDGWPWGTLAANLIGAFAAGFLAVWLESRGPAGLYWRTFLIVGVLGALTTYSALMLECLLFLRSARSGAMFQYLIVSLTAGFALVWLGAKLAEGLKTV